MISEPILIVGSGPSGLVIALTLARNGIPVRVIEKEKIRLPGERGAGIAPRTLELHKLLGTLPDILNAAKPLALIRQYDPADGHKVVKTMPLVPSQEPSPQKQFVNFMMLGQHRHEAILREHLQTLGVLVEGATELRSFNDNGAFVSAEIVHYVDGKEVIEHIKTPFLIGMDGAHSFVRKTLGLEFLGETQEGDNIAIGDIRTAELMELCERWGDPRRGIAFLRPSGHDDRIVQFLIAGQEIDVEKVIESRDSVVETFQRLTGRTDIIFEDLISAFRYRPNIRMVKQVRVGRIFIGGDAAHCHSPAGGQGMNSSVQDALNLGWKLALVYRGYAPSTLLDTYGEERLPVIAEMLNKTTELFRQVKASGGEAKRGVELNQLGVNYRGSSIVYEDGIEAATEKGGGYNNDSETAARPGDRAPAALGLKAINESDKTFNIQDIYAPNHHTILIFSHPDADFAAILEAIKLLPSDVTQTVLVLPKEIGTSNAGITPSSLFDLVIKDSEGLAYSGYHVKEAPCIVVIRPDGVVGARVRDASGLKKYLSNIFTF